MEPAPASSNQPAVLFQNVSAGGAIQVGVYEGPVYQGPAYERSDYAADVAALLAFHGERFVARRDELQAIARFGGGAAPGYLLVEAPGGFGKSSLTAQAVSRIRDGDWPAPRPIPLFFFVRADDGRNTATSLLQAVNAQLMDLLGVAGGTPTALDELRPQFSRLWSAAVAAATADAPLLLLVDGLDEMAQEDVSIAEVLPQVLPAHVHVVVTSRPVPDAREQVPREHPLRRTDVLALDAFGVDEVRLMLAHYGVVGDDLGVRVHALTGGEPLFARFVCEEVGRKGPTELSRFERDPPADVEQYFRDQLRQIREARLGELSWDVLGTLAVARGGLTRDELADLRGLRLRDVGDAVVPLERFLLDQERLELFHRRLQDLAATEFTASELREYGRRLVEWCRAYGERGWPPDTPLYAIAHYAEHLAEDDVDALLALPDGAWLRCHRTQNAGFAGFLRDVELALQAALARPDPLAGAIRLCLVDASVRSVVAGAPPKAIGVLARCGAVEEARAHAELVEYASDRMEVYRELGLALAATGDDVGAYEALARVHDELAAWELSGHAEVAALASVLAEVGDVAGLDRLAELVPALALALVDPSSHAASAAAVASAYARVGNPGRGAALLREVAPALLSEKFPEAEALGAVVRAANEVGADELATAVADDLDRVPASTGMPAMATLATMTTGIERDRWLARLEQALFELEPLDAALAARKTVPLLLPELPDAAVAIARSALAIARSPLGARGGGVLGDEGPLVYALDAIAAAGDVETLEKVDASLVATNYAYLDHMLVTIAAAYATLGRADEAIAVCARLSVGGGSYLAQGTSDVVDGLVRAGSVDRALEIARVAVPKARAVCLAVVARGLLDAGRREEAETTARLAVAAREQPTDELWRAEWLGAIASAYAAGGDGERALEAAERARDALRRTPPGARVQDVVEHVARGLLAVGRLDDAREVVGKDYLWTAEAEVIADVARACVQSGMDATALELADLVAEKAREVRIFSDSVPMAAIAAELFRALEDARADEWLDLAVAHAIRPPADMDEGSVSRVRARVAVAAAYAGRREEAEPLARSARDVAPGIYELAHSTWALRQAELADDARTAARAAVAAATAPVETEQPRAEVSARMLAQILPSLEHDEAVAALLGLRGDRPPLALAAIALELHRRGAGEAGAVLVDAIVGSRGTRPTLLQVLASSAEAIMAVDDGELLQQVDGWIDEVDGWWTAGST